ncbi:Nif3-like dinuclear metal center hexameric protein [Lachnospiraceae bacterium JLR.KK008]
MNCRELTKTLEALCPRSYAESWDNVGLLAGRYEKEIHTVLLAVDASDETVEEAVRCGADLLLTHHPLIFSPKKSVNDGDFVGRRLVTLLRNDVCYYAMHTNFDVLCMADAAAERIGLADREVLDVTCVLEGRENGIGRIGSLPSPMSLYECAQMVKRVFALDSVKLFGGRDQRTVRAAICPGSGKSVIEKAAAMGADVLITGDVDHHSGIDAMAMGLNIIDAGHYGLEKIFVPYMERVLKKECQMLNVMCAQESSPFWVI